MTALWRHGGNETRSPAPRLPNFLNIFSPKAQSEVPNATPNVVAQGAGPRKQARLPCTILILIRASPASRAHPVRQEIHTPHLKPAKIMDMARDDQCLNMNH